MHDATKYIGLQAPPSERVMLLMRPLTETEPSDSCTYAPESCSLSCPGSSRTLMDGRTTAYPFIFPCREGWADAIVASARISCSERPSPNQALAHVAACGLYLEVLFANYFLGNVTAVVTFTSGPLSGRSYQSSFDVGEPQTASAPVRTLLAVGCVRAHMHPCLLVLLRAHAHACVFICGVVCASASACVRVCACVRMCVRARACVPACVCVCSFMCGCVSMFVCACACARDYVLVCGCRTIELCADRKSNPTALRRLACIPNKDGVQGRGGFAPIRIALRAYMYSCIRTCMHTHVRVTLCACHAVCVPH